MSDETYWDPGAARKGKADIEETLEVNVARDLFLLIQRKLFL